MDKANLVQELNKAFNIYESPEDQYKKAGVEYRENTKSLWVKEHRYESMVKEPEPQVMSEEELFGRLLQERRKERSE